jgi:hypothetical protein
MKPLIRSLLLLLFLSAAACGQIKSDATLESAEPLLAETTPKNYGIFREVAKESGVTYGYRNGAEANQFTILESVGGGVALLDFDGDGLLDLFIAGGGYFDGADHRQIKGHGDRLYKNLGNFRFKDVTEEAGLASSIFYSHGCAVADYDCDGWPDLLVTGWGRLALYHNEPDGHGGRRFVEVAKSAGLPANLWTTSAAWGDIDGDGFPDLYLVRYVDWSWENNPTCPGLSAGIARDICPPGNFKGLPNCLYRNNRDGTFQDVSRSAGLCPNSSNAAVNQELGKGLGVLIADLNGDGKPDIYVANDGVDSFLYLNRSVRGDIRLEEEGLIRGVSRGERGAANGSMGIDAGDYDGSGNPSLWVTNYENQWHALYRNRGDGYFVFSTLTAGIGVIGQRFVGFGTSFVDLDQDGWQDLVVMNGHVARFPGYAPVQQRPVLLHNQGNGRFTDVTATGGDYFCEDHIGRGLAVGDLDNDGWPDLVVSHLNEPVAILRHQGPDSDMGRSLEHGTVHWLGIDLQGLHHRDLSGSRVSVRVGGRRLTRFVKGGGSYCSASDSRLLFGLGPGDHIEQVEVVWCWGNAQQWPGSEFEVNRYWILREGDPQASKRTVQQADARRLD